LTSPSPPSDPLSRHKLKLIVFLIIKPLYLPIY
jgi:hypothetical protein